MKARILLTCGDINGIGPELILKIFNSKNNINKFELKIIGPKKVFEYYSKLLKIKKIPEGYFLDLNEYSNIDVKIGEVSMLAGKVSGDAIRLGVDLCKKGYFDAMVTLPINKESLNLGGYKYSGHTEMLSHLTGSKDTFMMMYCEKLKIIPFTVHIPLNKVASQITMQKLSSKLILINNTLVKKIGIKKPNIAVLGLNPHCGDGGISGKEEIKIIEPVISSLKKAGFNIEGSFSSDGFFGSKQYTKFDIVLAMYHDQAMVPFKIISKDKGINFTGGLKIIRTSPAHGTAFDIAGKGIASESSTIEAIKFSEKLSLNF